jgi:carbamoyl-phosphate synthase large subunit
MEIVHSRNDLSRYIRVAFDAIEDTEAPSILIDEFLQDAVEVDVDCLSDGRKAVVGGILQHVEEAGVHSGDSTMVMPPHTLSNEIVDRIREATRALALELGVVGLMNVQFAVRQGNVYVIEVNPRASRTVPFVSKVIGKPLAKLATRVMMGQTLQDVGLTEEIVPAHVAVKESVLPFAKFPGVDTLLGPEMRSTGEVMGIGAGFAEAFGKAMLASGNRLPEEGVAFISVRDEDKPAACEVAKRLVASGFRIVGTNGTVRALEQAGVQAERVNKVAAGSPHCVDLIEGGSVRLVINTTSDAIAVKDSFSIRRATLVAGVSYFTTIAAALAAADAVAERRARGGHVNVRSLQEYHGGA